MNTMFDFVLRGIDRQVYCAEVKPAVSSAQCEFNHVCMLDVLKYDVRLWELNDNRIPPTGLKALRIQDFVRVREEQLTPEQRLLKAQDLRMRRVDEHV